MVRKEKGGFFIPRLSLGHPLTHGKKRDDVMEIEQHSTTNPSTNLHPSLGSCLSNSGPL